MTHDAVQFSGSVWDGSGRADPACLTGRQATPLSGTTSHNPLNNAGTKVSFSDRLHQAEGIADAQVHLLHECPLLLELLLQSCIRRMWVLALDPGKDLKPPPLRILIPDVSP